MWLHEAVTVIGLSSAWWICSGGGAKIRVSGAYDEVVVINSRWKDGCRAAVVAIDGRPAFVERGS
jgi:hypothetical protein